MRIDTFFPIVNIKIDERIYSKGENFNWSVCIRISFIRFSIFIVYKILFEPSSENTRIVQNNNNNNTNIAQIVS